MNTPRLITASEAPLMVPCAMAFFEEFKLSGAFSKLSFVASWMAMIRSGAGFVFAIFGTAGEIVGAIGMSVAVDIATGDKICAEMFYYVDAGHRGGGLRLLQMAEDEAVRLRCRRIWMIHLENERAAGMSKLYERKGFSLKEHLYMKEL